MIEYEMTKLNIEEYDVTKRVKVGVNTETYRYRIRIERRPDRSLRRVVISPDYSINDVEISKAIIDLLKFLREKAILPELE